MDTSKTLQASRVIEAPAHDIFALLADPSRHNEFDGADMVRGVEGESESIIGLGQTFTMRMNNSALGDYRTINTVTAFVPDARIGWGPRLDPSCEAAEKLKGVQVGGHTFTYDLREVEGGTEVAQTYEWMSVKDPNFEKMLPFVSVQQLAASLDRIADAVI